VLPLLALALIFPERRIDLLAVGSLWILFGRLPHETHAAGRLAVAASMLLAVGVLAIVFWAARHFRKLPRWIQRHPVLVLHIVLYGSVGLTYALPRFIEAFPWTWALVASFRRIVLFVIWRCSYSMLAGKRGSAENSRFRDHFFYFLPVWG